MRLSLKLSALCAVAAIMPVVIISLVVLRKVPSQPDYTAEQLQSNARAAVSIYEKRLEQMRLAGQHLANEIAVKIIGPGNSSDANRRLARLQDLLGRARDDLGLDFLVVTDNAGRVIARHNDLPAPGETVLTTGGKSTLAGEIIAGGSQLKTSPLAGCVIEPAEQLARLWLDKAAQVGRENGPPVTEALMMEAAAPIFSARGFDGSILIAQMLNNYYVGRPGATGLQTPLVAEIRQTLFRVSDKEAGALVALGDTVVASSVREASGVKPLLLGARRKPDRSGEILRSGSRSYSVSWQPLKSLDGSELGALGVATPLLEPAWPTVSAIRMTVVVGAVTVLLAALVGFLIGRAIAARINSLTTAVSRMSVGELSTTVRDCDSLNGSRKGGTLARDEISRLAEQLDQMRESFRQAIDRLRRR